MRKFALVLLAVVLLVSFSVAADKAPAGKGQKLSGYISDEKCGATGIGNADCVKRCVADGKKMVFVSDKDHAVLNVANQAILKGHEGEHVSITAQEVKGELRISKIDVLK